jgi:WD40 repeat protein
VLSIAWCPQDPDLLVSCGKDNRILCWNPNSNVPGGEVVCDISTANQWNFDVSWCPRNPALIASCSFDGRVSVYSLTGGQQQVQTSNKVGDVLLSCYYLFFPQSVGFHTKCKFNFCSYQSSIISTLYETENFISFSKMALSYGNIFV